MEYRKGVRCSMRHLTMSNHPLVAVCVALIPYRGAKRLFPEATITGAVLMFP